LSQNLKIYFKKFSYGNLLSQTLKIYCHINLPLHIHSNESNNFRFNYSDKIK